MECLKSFTLTLEKIISSPIWHARWLNTLSYLENCGARKIASCEDRTLVTIEMLQHAAEEFRHAYILKKQISKIGSYIPENYTLPLLLGEFSALHYLDKLDVQISQMLKREYNHQGKKLKYAAYLLVTYAIEVRASALYPLYQTLLYKHGFTISLRALIAEEDRHLTDIAKALASIPNHRELMEKVSELEKKLFSDFALHLEREMTPGPSKVLISLHGKSYENPKR